MGSIQFLDAIGTSHRLPAEKHHTKVLHSRDYKSVVIMSWGFYSQFYLFSGNLKLNFFFCKKKYFIIAAKALKKFES
jgi:hypothetical protein